MSNGTEVLAHAAKGWLEYGAGDHSGLLQIDIANAFNTICRRHVLEQTRRILPALSPLVELMYVEPSPLFCGADTILSQRARVILWRLYYSAWCSSQYSTRWPTCTWNGLPPFLMLFTSWQS